jgi:hypothetical protein
MTTLKKPLPRTATGDLNVRPFMIQIVKERYDAIMAEPGLIKTNPWATTKPYYNLRKMLDNLGYDIGEKYPMTHHKNPDKVILAERRPYIQGRMLTEICENEFGMKRHQLGIFVDERTQFAYRGQSQSVGFDDIDDLMEKGTDFILCEKAYVVKTLTPLMEPYGIALLECGGNFVEYATMLCEEAKERGCNVALLTDFDISGIAMCINIPWATRIGIDDSTIRHFGFNEEQIRLVQESYNADPKQMTFVTETLDKYDDFELDDSEDYEYNIDLIESLQYDNRKPLKYLESTRIELDHVIDEAGVRRFFDYVMWKLEDAFPERDYNYAVDLPYIDELRPSIAKEFIARMDKLFQNIPGLQPKIKEIQKEFKDETNEIEPIDDIRDNMLEKIIETEVSDTKVKKLLPKLAKILKQLELPDLTEEEKEDLK